MPRAETCLCGNDLEGRVQRCRQCGSGMCSECAALSRSTAMGPAAGMCGACNPGLQDARQAKRAEENQGAPTGGTNPRELHGGNVQGKPGTGR